jgi:hypothetical protein
METQEKCYIFCYMLRFESKQISSSFILFSSRHSRGNPNDRYNLYSALHIRVTLGEILSHEENQNCCFC